MTKAGGEWLDAPVSGSKVPAEQGTLVILAGGDEDAIRTHEPLLLCVGRKVIHCDPVGSGSAMKLAINLLLGTMMAGLAESVCLAEHSGLAVETLLEAIAAGPLACPLFQVKEAMLTSGHFPAQFPFKHMAKDMQLVCAAALEHGAVLPIGSRLAELYSPDASPELLDQDFAAIKTLLDHG